MSKAVLSDKPINSTEVTLMPPKKTSAGSSANPGKQIPLECPFCTALEEQYNTVIGQIKEVLERHHPSLREKARELHRLQENRDEAIEAFYAHKRMHRLSRWHAPGQNAA